MVEHLSNMVMLKVRSPRVKMILNKGEFDMPQTLDDRLLNPKH